MYIILEIRGMGVGGIYPKNLMAFTALLTTPRCPSRYLLHSALYELLTDLRTYVRVYLVRDERIPVALLRRREVKWLEMLENWEKWMSKRFRKVCIYRQIDCQTCHRHGNIGCNSLHLMHLMRLNITRTSVFAAMPSNACTNLFARGRRATVRITYL